MTEKKWSDAIRVMTALGFAVGLAVGFNLAVFLVIVMFA